MDEFAVYADRENFRAEFLQLVELAGDRRQFGWSDEGEITGIEAEQDPFPEMIG
jgi:hypothetical protein